MPLTQQQAAPAIQGHVHQAVSNQMHTDVPKPEIEARLKELTGGITGFSANYLRNIAEKALKQIDRYHEYSSHGFTNPIEADFILINLNPDVFSLFGLRMRIFRYNFGGANTLEYRLDYNGVMVQSATRNL